MKIGEDHRHIMNLDNITISLYGLRTVFENLHLDTQIWKG